MPDTATDAGTDISTLIRPPSAADIASVGRDLTGAAREKYESDTKTASDVESQLGKDQSRVGQWQKAVEATGIEAAKFPKWDEQEKWRETHTDPIEAFGSLGSVFGILASAFTHAPMENALNASAAAMNAIKKGDDAAYERAHTAYKDNLELALKRHELMRTEYQDAVTLMKTNLAAGEIKFKLAATKYGDKKALVMAEHGFDEDLFKMIDARNKSAEGLRQSALNITQDDMRDKLFKQAQKSYAQIPDPMQRAAAEYAAFQEFYGQHKDPIEQQASINLLDKAAREGRSPTAEEWAELKRKLSPYSTRFNADAAIIEALRAEHERNGLPEPTAGEIAEAISKAKGRGAAGSTSLTVDRQNAAAADEFAKKLRADHPDMPEEEVQKRRAEKYSELKTASAGLTGTRKDELQGRLDQINYVKRDISGAVDILKRHNLITGAGGMIGRPSESIASALGSNSTAWHEFESRVAEIKQREPRIALDAKGRPLATENELVGKIVRGLNFGDTKSITLERFVQLMKDMDDYERDTARRLHGESDPTKAANEKPKSTGKMPWERDPIK